MWGDPHRLPDTPAIGLRSLPFFVRLQKPCGPAEAKFNVVPTHLTAHDALRKG